MRPPRSHESEPAAGAVLASDPAADPLSSSERPELTPTWHILVPLVTVVVALLALALAPPLLTRHNAELRRGLSGVLGPLATLQTQLERSVALEAAAIRGFALTGDPSFTDRFLAANESAGIIEVALDSLADQASAEVHSAASRLLAERVLWETVNFGLGPTDFRDRLPEHQQRYEAVMAASADLDRRLDVEIEAVRQQIRNAEERRSHVTVALAVVAIAAAIGALWLAYRLRRSGQHLLRWAREEAALRHLAQTMAEAGDLPGALERIVRLVAATTGADGAHIEEADDDREETEVVVAIGSAAAREGARAPYAGSLTERALARGNVVETEGRTDGGEDRHLLVVPLLSEGEALGVLQLARMARPFTLAEVQRTRLLADMAALVLRRLHLFAEVRAKEQALAATAAELRALNETLERRVEERTLRVQELARALTLAEQHERRELAQVLHDDLQQILFGLQLSLQTLAEKTPRLDTDLQCELQRTRDLAGEAIDTTRRLTADLSPPVLAGDGLLGTFEWLAAHVEERFGLRVELHADDALSTPSEDMRVLLFQTVRELLFNVVKHADANRAVLSLCERDGVFTVEVADDGIGFDPSALNAPSNGTFGGFGLHAARERLALFDGRVRLDSSPGSGTRATVAVPVEQLRSA